MWTLNNRREINTGVHPIYGPDFDLKEIEASLSGPAVTVPDDVSDFESFERWIKTI